MSEHRTLDKEGAYAQAQLASLLQGSADAIVATRLDGVVTLWSFGAETLYGYQGEDVLGKHVSFLYLAQDVARESDVLTRIAQGTPSGFVESSLLRNDGTLVDVERRMSPIVDDAGIIVGALTIGRDVAERRAHEHELRESREFLERTQAIGHIGSWKTQVGPEMLLTCSPEAYRIFGMADGTPIRNVDFFNLIHPEDRQLLLETMIKVRTSGSRSETEVRFNRADGETRWLFLAADAQLDEKGELVGTTGVVQDITERKETELRVAHDALHDPLTGLANRALFLDRVTRGITRAARDRSRFAVLYVDLDRFQLVNDARNNRFGDALLQGVADRLRQTVPETDTIARFGADEFGLICDDISSATDAASRATDILEAIARPFSILGSEVHVTASIGIALSEPNSHPEALIRDADLAMYRAKEQGRNRFELFDLTLRHQVEQRFGLEADLRQALDANELFLAFQPIASLTTNRFVGVEALVRWRHKVRGVIEPNDFVPLAEETGLIRNIGAWVLESACEQMRHWRSVTEEASTWYVAVNVAASQLRAPEFPDIVQGVLQRSGLEAQALRIELTESSLIDDGVIAAALEKIRSLGVRIVVDDFGTKYSSLSYLTRLPIDELKIDQSFIERLVDSPSNKTIVSAILAMGRALDVAVTAEGVEKKDQLDELVSLGCEAVQGSYFASALDPESCFVAMRKLVI